MFSTQCVFLFWGIVCTDVESDTCFGVETCNSFTAEMHANVFALQSSIEDETNVAFLCDNQAAAQAVTGQVVSWTNGITCKVGIAVDRLCGKLYCTSTRHTHSHDVTLGTSLPILLELYCQETSRGKR